MNYGCAAVGNRAVPHFTAARFMENLLAMLFRPYVAFSRAPRKRRPAAHACDSGT